MFNKKVVYEALNSSTEQANSAGQYIQMAEKEQDTIISQLIYDVFGGEILKTHKKKGWHFYNRINGERIDFTCSEKASFSGVISFEDIPSNAEETRIYFDRKIIQAS